ncbi:MAG: ATP-dependent helicase [Chloroflexi bacterium]|nr:ATP-dependent helicase [Chloroflexota bacterium]
MTQPSIRLRSGQEAVLRYQGGRMGISAVPGSGKTWTLAYLAANLIKRGVIDADQEILVVTLVNAAVDNFSSRISQQLQVEGLLPGYGYRVRTLHGLANDIVRERPDLAGLNTNFQIIDEFECDRIKSRIAKDWIASHPGYLEPYLEYAPNQKNQVFSARQNLPRTIEQIANAFIRLAKDRELMPADIEKKLGKLQIPLPLVRMGLDMYTEYQNALTYRGGVDFDDLIRLALRCLRSDPSLLVLLRKRWPFILEDEAQDSSRLQQEILSLLAGDGGNWVRVGDPNQAIYESFTTASPQFLLDYLAHPNVEERTLPESGRSTQDIIDLANHMIMWTQTDHPNLGVRNALTPPFILPTPWDDPQPNPPACPACIRLLTQGMGPDEEMRHVVKTAQSFLEKQPDQTVAILCLSNERAYKYAELLKQEHVPCVDSLLRSSSSTRLSTDAMVTILRSLADPTSSRKLAEAYKIWRRKAHEDEAAWKFHQGVARLVGKCRNLEDYLWPSGGQDWRAETAEEGGEPAVLDELRAFQGLVQRWHSAVILPIDQLLLTIAQDLFLDPVELALAYKLSTLLRQMSDAHLEWRLPQFIDELVTITKNERKYLGFSADDDAFDPDRYPGQVVVGTMHKAKGLEWDCVFLTALNNYNFPSGAPYDQ